MVFISIIYIWKYPCYNNDKVGGKEYYLENKVLKLFKNKNKYFTKVLGNNDNVYDVNIEIKNNKIEYMCSCPCEYPCKHAYATLLAIDNKDYFEIDLKEEIKEPNYSLAEIIAKIPAEELKKYMLSKMGMDKICLEINAFNSYFRAYLPILPYEYYYNNLYNIIALEDNENKLTEEYLNRASEYINGHNFNEALKIIKAIIAVYHDTDMIDYNEYFIGILPKIGMFLRIILRQGDETVKKELLEFLKELEKEEYYYNFYLEDMVLKEINFNENK